MIKKINFPLIGILVYFLIVCFYRLDSIPGEWFGDVSIVNSYVTEINNWQWPSNFNTSQGPLYYYLIAPFISVFGATYLNYKICSIATGLVGIIFIYLFVKTLTNKATGLIASFVTASSFWYLVWCRLGYNIIGPVISAVSLFLFFYYRKNQEKKYLYLGIFISCLGLINYAGTFLLPLSVITIYLLDAIFKSKPTTKSVILTLTIFAILLSPAIFIFKQNSQNFSSSYMGEKLFQVQQNSLLENIDHAATYLRRTLGMFQFEGDVVFRWNVPKTPHLDILSGLFLIIGLHYLIIKKKFTTILLLMAAFILIIPSIYPGHPPAEVPSSPRTNAIIPIVMFLTSYGIYSVSRSIKKISPICSTPFIFLIIFMISFLNLKKYFIDYPPGLPNNNTPFGKIIAKDIDNLPANTSVDLTDVGWGDWGQPEFEGIYYALKNKNGRENILQNTINDCDEVDQASDNYLIFNPDDVEKLEKFQQCFPQSSFQTHLVNDQLIYDSLFIKSNPE